MDASLATTYTLIHSFLRKHSHTKAALAVKKAAKDIVVLKDDIEIEEPHLDTIIKEWKASKTEVSSSDSSSDSDSEDSSDSSDSDSSDSSDSDSSDSSDTSTSATSKPTKGEVVSKPGKPHEQVKTKIESKMTSSSDESSSVSSDSDDSSDSDSDSESSDSDTKTIKPDQKLIKTKDAKKAEVERQSSQTLTSGNSSSSSVASDRKEGKKADNSDSSDSEDDDSEDDAAKPAKKVISTSTEKAESRATKQNKNKNKRGSSFSSTSDSSSSDSDSSIIEEKPDAIKSNKKHIITTGGDATPAPATKKRRTNEDGAAVVTATTETVELPKSGPQFDGRIKANGKPARKTNTPFKRVDLEKVDQQSLLQDNGYMSKAAPTNDYGARAHQDLIVTRGAGFRKEKNKKKRGSYKGGTITLESHSFKFT